MVLVDTSVWVDHLSRGNARLAKFLEDGLVVTHCFVIGELACGQLRSRQEVLGLLATLPKARFANHDELLHLVERNRLYGRGLGWIDVHLLGAALLSSCTLWTMDKALDQAAKTLQIDLVPG